MKTAVIPEIGKKRLADIQAFDLQSLSVRLRERGLSSKTIHFIHTLLKNVLRQAVRWQMIRQNPADLIDAPRVERREMQALSSEQGCQRRSGFMTCAIVARQFCLLRERIPK